MASVYSALALSNKLIAKLFEANSAEFNKSIIKLVKDNRQLKGGDGFMFQGKYYSDIVGAYRNHQRVSLDFSLYDRMNQLMQSSRVWLSDQDKIRQSINLLLLDCNNMQDQRDALPNTLVNLSDELKQIPRIREEAWTIINNPMHYRQYLKIRDKIDYYSAMKLLM